MAQQKLVILVETTRYKNHANLTATDEINYTKVTYYSFFKVNKQNESFTNQKDLSQLHWRCNPVSQQCLPSRNAC